MNQSCSPPSLIQEGSTQDVTIIPNLRTHKKFEGTNAILPAHVSYIYKSFL